ncbi:TonB-dependent receptor [Porphyromonadaceae bacterium OttesenSCG-928-L07]|nr:TonB-dependent receptor [Porphyromonadaceae bacterium OttesenSCG-928-L07]MDL2251983.1 TonB-dependent receptor [Odoribacter sp. OttesenSCG-928-J03]MDL2330815.1 TonB-dependent receptor [Odoribacter sp. OttesenSCG-928-A06]
MKKQIGLVALLCIMGLQVCFAQTREITGTVTDKSDKMPLPGVSVVIKGKTTVGTATDTRGQFKLTVEPNDVLIFTFIGMESQEILVGNRNVVNVELVGEAEALEEIIVVAYGTVKREAKTGSVSSVGGDALAESPVTSVDKALSGKMAGVSITAQSGQPGASTDIRIRGTSSINAGSDPLWVVDGIPVMNENQSIFTNTGNSIASINPNDIESITVLKDAAAASVYGSRAANGVILVTTKSGKEGQGKFTARAKYGVSWLANDNDYGVMTARELLDYQRTAAVNAGQDPDNPASIYYRPMELLSRPLTNWMDHMTRLGTLQEYEINASAGNARGKYYSSLTFHKNEGVYYGVDFKKITARINADYKLTKSLETGTRLNMAYMEGNDVPMQSLYYSNPAWAGLLILPWTQPYDEEGNHNVNIAENSNSNPRATAEYDEQLDKQYRFQGSMYLQWEPIKKLLVKTNNAIESTFGQGRRYWAPENHGGEATLQTSRVEVIQLTTSNTITYSDLIDNAHSVRVLVGQEAMRRDFDYFYAYSPNVDPGIPYPTSAPRDKDYASYSKNSRTLMSFFGILDYNYLSKYYLQASMRYDGSSLFGEDNKWGLFWSLGGSWNIHNENFMNDVSFLDVLKLRFSYGVNGNNDIAPYRAYGLYTTTQYNGVSGFRPSTPENKKLSWEKNYTWNGGVDFGFLGRINGSIDFYNRITKDMLLSKSVPQTTGFSSNFMNIGKMRNRGVEFQVDVDIFKDTEVKWSVGGNISFNKTKIINLGENDWVAYIPPTDPDQQPESRLRHVKGKSLLTYYLLDYYGVNPVNGEALYRAEDGSITNQYSQAAWIYAGSPEPKYTGGFNTSVSWKGLELGMLFEFKGGNKVMIIENRYIQSDGNQMNMNQAKGAKNYWKKPGDTGVNPKPIAGNSSNSYNFSTTRMLEKGDYLRVKDITLSYNLPKHIVNKAMLKSARVYVSAQNIYTFHDVHFWDPERGIDGMGYGIYPMTKSFVGGLEISF